jgi:hypothetical protein
MNAHTPIVADFAPAKRALSDLENPLTRVIDLARSASTVVEHELGARDPAGQLDTLLQLIIEEAEKAGAIRERGWREAQ